MQTFFIGQHSRIFLVMHSIRRFNQYRGFPSTTRRALSVAQGAEKKANEVGGGLAKWFKKYAIILVPGTFFTILTVDVVNNVNHRDFVEKIIPTYIDLVRKYHGFDDEDFPEKKRLEFLDRFYNNEFKLQIRLQDGSRKEISVSGRQSVAELVAETLRDSQNNKPIAQTDIFCSNIVEVEDGEVESETYSIGDNSPTASSMLGNTESNLSHDSQTNSAQDGFLNSHWTPHLSEDYRQVLNFRYRFYENLVFRPYVCIQAYLAMGTPGLFPFSYGQEQPRRLASEQSSHRSNSLPSQQQGGFGFFSSASNSNSSASASSGTSDLSQADQDRLQAKRQVQNLESEIKQLEQQKLMGYRDIDSVNEEIQQKRTEINRLRRTYLNGFFSLW